MRSITKVKQPELKQIFRMLAAGLSAILFVLFSSSSYGTNGLVPVIVKSNILEGPDTAAHAKSIADLDLMKAEWHNSRFGLIKTQVLKNRGSCKEDNGCVSFGKFNDPSLRSMRLAPDEIEELRKIAGFSVYPNLLHTSSLASSVPLIFPDQVTSEFNGTGVSVVVLDSGVDSGHTFLSGKVDQELAACFSNDNNGPGAPLGGVSLCPDGDDIGTDPDGSIVGVGAGESCDQSIIGCSHGTQMAGIVVGSNASSNGVSLGATIIPIQVYTKITDESSCGGPAFTPCIGALTSDLIRALEYIDTIKSQRKIGAVNISFGSSSLFQGFCDNQPEKAAVDALRNSGISVVASSGNRSSSVAMTSPACLSSVISIAASDNDDIALDSNNRNSTLNYFAPGNNIITSSVGPNNFSSVTGTSAAAAHVSATIAVLISKNPTASVDQVISALNDSDIDVSQGLVTKPRIDATAALAALPENPSMESDICIPIRAANASIALICL